MSLAVQEPWPEQPFWITGEREADAKIKKHVRIDEIYVHDINANISRCLCCVVRVRCGVRVASPEVTRGCLNDRWMIHEWAWVREQKKTHGHTVAAQD